MEKKEKKNETNQNYRFRIQQQSQTKTVNDRGGGKGGKNKNIHGVKLPTLRKSEEIKNDLEGDDEGDTGNHARPKRSKLVNYKSRGNTSQIQNTESANLRDLAGEYAAQMVNVKTSGQDRTWKERLNQSVIDQDSYKMFARSPRAPNLLHPPKPVLPKIEKLPEKQDGGGGGGSDVYSAREHGIDIIVPSMQDEHVDISDG